MNQLDMEMATTNRIGKVKMKLLRYLDDEGYRESPRPGRGMAIAIMIGFILAPFVAVLSIWLAPKIDYWMGEFLKWLMI